MSKEYDPEYEIYKCEQRLKDKRPTPGPCPICGSNPSLLIRYLGKPDGQGYPGCFTFQYKCPECGYLETDDIDSIYRSEEDAVDMAAKMWNDYSKDINTFIDSTRNKSTVNIGHPSIEVKKEEAWNKLLKLGVIDEDGNITEEYKDIIVKDTEPPVGYKDDEIFLPSVDEYEKYKDVIPSINTYWWTRTPGQKILTDMAISIITPAKTIQLDAFVAHNAVRPMIHLPNGTTEINAPIGAKINLYNFPWVVIDKHLAIAEVPIGFEKFDGNWNDYLTSHIRNYLNRWLNERKEKID